MFKIIRTKTPSRGQNNRRPTRKQRKLLAAANEVAHPNAEYIIHHADADGWRGISRVPIHLSMSYFRGTITKYEKNLWKYNVGECKTTYLYRYPANVRRTSTHKVNATHTVILNNGDTFTCTSMRDVKQELKRRGA